MLSPSEPRRNRGLRFWQSIEEGALAAAIRLLPCSHIKPPYIAYLEVQGSYNQAITASVNHHLSPLSRVAQVIFGLEVTWWSSYNCPGSPSSSPFTVRTLHSPLYMSFDHGSYPACWASVRQVPPDTSSVIQVSTGE